MKKLVVSNGKQIVRDFNESEIAQANIDEANRLEKEMIESLVPSNEEIENAELDIKMITLLTELGVL